MELLFNRRKLLLLFLILVTSVLAALASINKVVLLSFLLLYCLTVLVINKKLISFILISPFISLSFMPSGYVSLFRINMGFGELRLPFIVICLVLILSPILSGFKFNLNIFKELKSLWITNILFFICNLISILINHLSVDNFRFSFFTFINSSGLLFLAVIFQKQIDALKIIKSCLLISTFVCIIGIIEFMGYQPYAPLYHIDNEWFNYDVANSSGLHRIVSSLGNPLVLSAYLLICFPFVLYIKEKTENRMTWNAVTILHLLAILLTQSRSAYIVLVLILLIFSKRNIKVIFRNFIIASLILGVFYFMLQLFGLTQNFQDRLFFRSESESYSFRADAYGLTVKLLSNTNPLFGLGPNMINSYLAKDSFSTIDTLDNGFLMVLVGTGIIGLLSFLLCLFVLWKKFRRLEPSLKRVGYSLLTIIIGMGFSFNVVYFESVWGIFWFLTGLLFLQKFKR